MRFVDAIAARLGVGLGRIHSTGALQDSEMRFRALTENSTDLITIFDAEGRAMYASPSVTRVLGWGPTELIGRNVFDYVHPEDRARVHEAFMRAVRSNDATGIRERFRFPHKSGSWRTFEAVVSNLLEVPSVRGIAINSRDITEQEHANVRLRSQERQLRAIVHTVSDVVLELDADGRYLNIWAADESKLARPRTELLGRRVEEALGVDAARLLAGPLRSVLGTGDPETLEYPLSLADGEHWFLGKLTRLSGLDGGPDTVCMGITDITDRKRAVAALQASETRFRALIENSMDLIAIFDADGRLSYASPSAQRILGYESGSLVGKVGLDYVHPEDAARVREAFGQAVASRDTTAIREHFRFRHADGSWRTFEAVVSNLLDIPAVRGVVVNCRDVTEQRSLEAQFRQAQRLEAVGRLAGGVAHDFNNILTAITGYSELLLGDLVPDDPKRGDVEEIRAAAQRAAALTRQLLAFSRRQVLQVKVLDLNTVVRTLERMLRRLMGEDVRLELALSADLGAVRADPAQIEQVIMNLAVNARDAMPAGGRLTIETSNVVLDESHARVHAGAEPGRYVMLAITDTGIGMDEETRSHIFEPFFTTKGPSQGTGLGLATVYGIVKQSGGNVWVYSEPGGGATFRLYIPRVDEEAESWGEPPTPSPAGGHETVLLAEDDASVRDVMAQALEQKGYQVLRASNGPMALELARAHRAHIDLLVTDLVMPDMTGRELATALLAERPGVRTIYMSGYADEAVVRHGVLERGLHYLQKPFAPVDLARKVRDVLDMSPNQSTAAKR
ncbi:MAG TPA: PAS domain S-box protein [Candidatus Methylomirabilis sp.]|nr:PAS domain S-box protein [Candidatus Methylomirabilis sp.]